MKHFLIFILICVMLGGAMKATWADIPTKNVNKNYGSCSSTDSDGPLSADASITVDVDYPGEGENLIDKAKSKIETILKGYGIQYEASARVFGEAPNDDYEGTSEVYANAALEDEDHKPRQEWQVKVDRKARASYRQELPKDHNWDDVHAKFELNLCSAWGDVDGSSPEKGGKWVVVEGPSEVSGSQITHWLEWRVEREALSHSAYAYAWNFPDPDEEDNSGENGGNETPNIGLSPSIPNPSPQPGDSITLDLVTAEPFYNVSWYVHTPWNTSSSGTYQQDSYGDGTATSARFDYTFPSGAMHTGDFVFRALIYRWSDMSYVGEETYTVTVE